MEATLKATEMRNEQRNMEKEVGCWLIRVKECLHLNES